MNTLKLTRRQERDANLRRVLRDCRTYPEAVQRVETEGRLRRGHAILFVQRNAGHLFNEAMKLGTANLTARTEGKSLSYFRFRGL